MLLLREILGNNVFVVKKGSPVRGLPCLSLDGLLELEPGGEWGGDAQDHHKHT